MKNEQDSPLNPPLGRNENASGTGIPRPLGTEGGINGRKAKRVTAFVGIGRKLHTWQAVEQFMNNLKALGDYETEILRLSDFKIGTCRGCQLCFDKGREFCPLKDDREVLIEKMWASDGIVLATPNYNFHVSGTMKVLLDRLGFMYHRPRFFGKVCTSIVVQGFFGGGKIVKYLDFAGGRLGFEAVKGSFSTALRPMTESDQRKRDKRLAAHSARYHRKMLNPAPHTPSAFELIGFKLGQAATRQTLDTSARDWQYYTERGWVESEYFYPVRLGPVKKMIGQAAKAIGNRRYAKKAAEVAKLMREEKMKNESRPEMGGE